MLKALEPTPISDGSPVSVTVAEPGESLQIEQQFELGEVNQNEMKLAIPPKSPSQDCRGRPTSLKRTLSVNTSVQSLTNSSPRIYGRSPSYELKSPSSLTPQSTGGKGLSILQAICKGFFHQVRFLTELGANVDARDSVGRTALMLCSMIQEDLWATSLTSTLLEKGASQTAKDYKGRTALHYATIRLRLPLLDLYAKAADFDPLAKDSLGNTPLHYAVVEGNATVVTVLMDVLSRYRLEGECVVNKRGLTPGTLANHIDNSEAIRERLKRSVLSGKPASQPNKKDSLETNESSSNQKSHVFMQSHSKLFMKASRPLTRAHTFHTTHLRHKVKGRASKEIMKDTILDNINNNSPNSALAKHVAETLNAACELKKQVGFTEAAPRDLYRHHPERVFNVKPQDLFQENVFPAFPISNGHGYKPLVDDKPLDLSGSKSPSWRQGFKRLWSTYTDQSSASFLPAANPLPVPVQEIPLMVPGLHEELKRIPSSSRSSGGVVKSRAPSVIGVTDRKEKKHGGRRVSSIVPSLNRGLTRSSIKTSS